MTGDPSRSSKSAASEFPPNRPRLGELLVENKLIASEQVDEALAVAREEGKKLGQVLIERGHISELQLAQTLSQQLSVPWVSLSHVDFPPALLRRVSRDLAEKYCLVPVFLRQVRGQGETLYIATIDPTSESVMREVSRQAGLPVRPMIASASDIRSAIRLYYAGGEGTASVALGGLPPVGVRSIPPPVPDAAHAPVTVTMEKPKSEGKLRAAMQTKSPEAVAQAAVAVLIRKGLLTEGELLEELQKP